MAQDISPVLLLSNPLVRRMSKVKTVDAASDWWNSLGLSVAATQNIEDVEDEWRQLEAKGIESPGQSIDFIKAWIKRFDIPRSEQLYVTGSARGKIAALMPLRRCQQMGADILTWFPGVHVGCNAPLVDRDVFADLNSAERTEFWQRMQRGMFGADLVLLDAVPRFEGDDCFSQLGESVEAETLYRSEYESWEACDKNQRNRSRRKHDKQQGAKLAAMGEVSFEELTGSDDVEEALAILFRQKAHRFGEWGVENPFRDQSVRQFYADVLRGEEGLTGKLHVLRLDGEIVAVRYNLVHGKRNFALISSMSERSELHAGSPGKQNILRAMKAIFDNGNQICDMGEGFSDEKRHWCNVKIPLSTHYVALTPKGKTVAKLHRLKQRARRAIKSNDRLFSMFKSVRSAGVKVQ